MTRDSFLRSLACSEAIFAAVERARDRDATLAETRNGDCVAPAEGSQPGPRSGIAQVSDDKREIAEKAIFGRLDMPEGKGEME